MSESQSLAEAIRMMLKLQAGPNQTDDVDEGGGQNDADLLRDKWFPKTES